MSIGAGNAWLILLALIVFLLPCWKITSRTGFPGALSLLLLIPVANVIFLYVLAFSRWPALAWNN